LSKFFLVLLNLLFLPATALAGFDHLVNMYGIMPADIALAGARADGVPEPAAAYYNPAALGALTTTEITGAYILAQPYFRGGLAEAEDGFEQTNQIVSVGIGLDVGRLFKGNWPIGMGVNLLVDDNFNTIVAFDDLLHPNGQYIRYDTRSFSLAHSLGFGVWNGLSFGAGYLLTYTANVKLVQDVQINAATENEQIRLVGRPAFFPIFGLQWKNQWVRVGAVYRARLLAKVDPVSGFTTPKAGDTTIDVYPTEMKFLDGYSPHQFVLAVGLFPESAVTVTLQGEYHNWAQLNEEWGDGNLSRADVDIETRDVFVPRFGVSWRPNTQLEFRGGYAYEASPFTSLGSDSKLILDNDRHRIGLGSGYSPILPFMTQPVTFDAALFYLPLVPREETTIDGHRLRSSGALVGGALSFTIRY